MPGPRSKENSIGPRGSQAKDLLEDASEAHLFTRPNRIQQNGLPNLTLFSARRLTNGEPSLIALLIAKQVDAASVKRRRQPITPPQKVNRSVSCNFGRGPVAAGKLREFLPIMTGFDSKF